MIVTDTTDWLVLQDASNFKGLLFETSQPSRTPIKGIQWADDEHVLIAVSTLRDLAGDDARRPEWTQSFDAMITYATSKGWVDAAGNVRMHVKRQIRRVC